VDHRIRLRHNLTAKYLLDEGITLSLAAESLLREVEEKRKKALSALEDDYAKKKEDITKPISSETAKISDIAKAQASELSQREKIRIEGAGKLQAKKLLFDATETMLESNLSAIKEAFAQYARSGEYPELLNRMLGYASRRLGGEIRVVCRKDDADLIRKAGVSPISADLNSIGGFIADNKDGSLELDLTFEEILRNHQEEVRSIIQTT
jgi:V/A-type H+/Na+-transporting ATPase subunit E